MIINITNFVFPILTYFVRLSREKNRRGEGGREEGAGKGSENYNREPNSPSPTFRCMTLIMNTHLCILWLCDKIKIRIR